MNPKDKEKKSAIAAMIIGKMSPKKESEESSDESEEKEMDDQSYACEDMMAAIKDNDHEAFKDALNAFLDMRK